MSESCRQKKQWESGCLMSDEYNGKRTWAMEWWISRLPCYVFCICLLTNKYQKYKSVELGDQLAHAHPDEDSHCQCLDQTDTQSSQLKTVAWILPTVKPICTIQVRLCKRSRLLFSILLCPPKTGCPPTETAECVSNTSVTCWSFFQIQRIWHLKLFLVPWIKITMWHIINLIPLGWVGDEKDFFSFLLFLLPRWEQAWVLCSVLWNVNRRTCANNYHFPKPLPTRASIWLKTLPVHFSIPQNS